MAAPVELLEEVLERALFAQADLIVPSPDGIHRIRAGAAAAAARRDRRWWRRVLRRWINPAPAGATAGPGPTGTTKRKDQSR